MLGSTIPRSEFKIRWTVNFLYSLIGGHFWEGWLNARRDEGAPCIKNGGLACWVWMSLFGTRFVMLPKQTNARVWARMTLHDLSMVIRDVELIWIIYIYVMSPSEVSCFFGFLFEQSILLSSCMFLCFCILLILLDIQWHLIWWVWRFEQIRSPRQSMPLPDEDDGHVPIPHRIEDQEKWSRKIHQPSKY